MSDIVDLSQLELYTEGDREQEQMLAGLLVQLGQDSLKTLQAHIEGRATEKEWKDTCHRLKGASAQIGANALSELCLKGEKNFQESSEFKKSLLRDIEEALAQVQEFFDKRKI